MLAEIVASVDPIALDWEFVALTFSLIANFGLVCGLVRLYDEWSKP